MDKEFARYSCQVALPGFGEQAQLALQHAKVLVVGMGGLGCPATQYLATSGIGTLGIVDDDIISVSNLHRQILYNENEVGQKKVVIAKQKLQQLNPSANIIVHETKINSDNALDIINDYDIVLDCTDNFDTTYLLNDACVIADKPLAYGAIYQYEGQVAVWNATNADGSKSPNYRDVFPDVNAAMIPDCADGGVLPTLAGIIGCMQANEVIKYITKTGEILAGKLLIFDAQTMQNRVMKISGVTKTNITSLEQSINIPTITIQELQSSIDDYELIDVRSIEEHIAFNIGGRNIPLDEIVSFIPNGKTVVFYCASGKRSAEAVRIIKQQNLNIAALSLEGGINH
ncbi:MAG: HesA/MoeB/ThiF family protein [Bacteroidetes bacterium]|nr:HesA/MoeB/ThiF family protein [Bacteroidota bacterium]